MQKPHHLAATRLRRTWMVLLLLCGVPISGCCCEPIVPLVHLLSGATLAGPALITQSALWLIAAVSIKCGAFAFLERRLTWSRAALFMLLANVLSTIPGVFIAAAAGSVGGFFIAIPLVCLLGWILKRRI